MTDRNSGSYVLATKNFNSNMVLTIVCKYPEYHTDGDFYGEKLRRFGVTYLVGIEPRVKISFLEGLTKQIHHVRRKNDNCSRYPYNTSEQRAAAHRRELIDLGYKFD